MFKRVTYTGQVDPLVEITESKVPYSELVPGEDELLVKVEANAINPTDFKHFYVQWGDKGCTVGSDLAGTVIKVGGNDDHFKVGDYVATFVHGGYKGARDSGAFQEYVVVPKSISLKFNKKLNHSTGAHVDSSSKIDTFEAASSLPLGLSTVGMSFQNNFKLKPGNKSDDWILIWGATTATGYLAVQIARKVYGLKVIATANKEKYGAKLLELGVDEVVDYKSPDVVKQLKNLTNDNIKYALDTVSVKETYNSTYDALRPKSKGKAYLDNLLFLDASAIENENGEEKDVTFLKTLAYLVSGKDQDLNGWILKSSEEIANDHKDFWKVINEFVNNEQIEHLPLTILEGFESANEGLKLLSDNKVHFEKIILRI
jgi:NADPH:quinone reductase-like Zn-dependent oxidoreductase